MKARERARLTVARLEAQRITPGPIGDVLDTVRWMGALQGQDLPGVLWSVGLRMPGSTVGEVHAALADGSVVRSWPFRGTLHLVAASDLGWMLDLTADRTISSVAARFRQLGLDDVVLSIARAAAEDVLAVAGGPVSREALFAAFTAAGIDTGANRGANLIWYLAHRRVLCLGPMLESGQGFVLFDAWTTAMDTASIAPREAHVLDLVTRYFTSHGPATVKDFQWWSRLLAKETAGALAEAAASGALEWAVVDGTTYWMRPGALDAVGTRGGSAVHLMPGFDEYLLGYADRSAALAPEHAEAIVPGNNGMFMPTIVAGGQVVGTWSRRTKRASVSLQLTPFDGLSPTQVMAAGRRAKRYGGFVGLTAELTAPIDARLSAPGTAPAGGSGRG